MFLARAEQAPTRWNRRTLCSVGVAVSGG